MLVGVLLLLLVSGVLAAETAVLAHLEPLGGLLLVLGRAVVAALAVAARQLDDVSHGSLASLARSLAASGSRLAARKRRRHRPRRQNRRGLVALAPTRSLPKSCPRPPCGRPRGSRSGRPSRSPPG